MSFLVCFEPGWGHTAFAGVLAQLRAVHISITRCHQITPDVKIVRFFIKEAVKFMFSNNITTILSSSPLAPHI